MKGCVLERSTPFQLRCHSQISCLRGKRRSTHALFFEYLLQVPALGSAHSAAPIQALHEEGPWPTTPPADSREHRPRRPWPFEGLCSRVGWGHQGPQEGSLRRGVRRPHLDPDFVGGEPAPADSHCLRVAHIDLEEVAGRPVGVIQVLRLSDQPPGVRHGLRHFAAAAVAAAAAGSLHPLGVPPTPLPPLLPAAGTPGSRAAVAGRTSTYGGCSLRTRSSSPRPSGFRLLSPRGEQLTRRNAASWAGSPRGNRGG